ncbi:MULTISPECIES: hypothetical protein [unclassified Undibacterium]|uniref:hypothetical protein n=1 Tax=unclassified Undibacterium TaxID=2630295 RepID=UPI002AC99FBA|nr:MULTISPECIES: hypothetical protein [unclassified Undibacterium]MEB0138205.1 hypothetical protein [Undibacterium sp. CCC2.1]MEB0173978.1 hypothetical protein [Undibacterium sp. CCC1.1]MEB0176806.1 hypothetical protein [Undibacterium sp. CCC3.4]MEB0217161.1 hypothetical protein [Undibacterium sp. 5I2]WPX45321.1 hypothetical protein RHM61_08940 [Undibacterium sp. CCC3.4]
MKNFLTRKLSGLTVSLCLQLGIASLLALGMHAAQAQSAATGKTTESAVTVELIQAKVTKTADGKEHFSSADSIRPGDVIEYRAVYTNRTDKPVNGVIATLPVPEGLEYLPHSAKPNVNVQAAAKNGEFAAEPLMHLVAGKSTPRPYADYRKVNWQLGQLPAHGKATVSLRVGVQVYVPVVAPNTPAVLPTKK